MMQYARTSRPSRSLPSAHNIPSAFHMIPHDRVDNIPFARVSTAVGFCGNPRPWQVNTASAVGSGLDTILIAPTGSGKTTVFRRRRGGGRRVRRRRGCGGFGGGEGASCV